MDLTRRAGLDHYCERNSVWGTAKKAIYRLAAQPTYDGFARGKHWNSLFLRINNSVHDVFLLFTAALTVK